MITDWKRQIAIAWLVKQELKQIDSKKVFPYHLPEVGAGIDEIERAEQYLGYPLDQRYREFLTYANGWPAFYQAVDLFGTAEVASN